MSEFTIAGLIHNLDTIRELLNGAQTCLATDLEELGVTLVKVSIYVVDRTRERVMIKEDK